MYLQNLVADITKILSLSFGSIKRYREGDMKIVFVRRRLFLSIEQLQAAAEGVLSNCILQVLQHKYSDNSQALYLESLMFD